MLPRFQSSFSGNQHSHLIRAINDTYTNMMEKQIVFIAVKLQLIYPTCFTYAPKACVIIYKQSMGGSYTRHNPMPRCHLIEHVHQ